MIDKDRLDEIVAAVLAELQEATRKFGAFNSTHEGYAVILEELDELWDEVKLHGGLDGKHCACMRKEAIQVAAMGLRFLYDCC